MEIVQLMSYMAKLKLKTKIPNTLQQRIRLHVPLRVADKSAKLLMLLEALERPALNSKNTKEGRDLQSVVTFPTPKAAQFKRKIWSVLGIGQPLNVRRTCSAASCVANSTKP